MLVLGNLQAQMDPRNVALGVHWPAIYAIFSSTHCGLAALAIAQGTDPSRSPAIGLTCGVDGLVPAQLAHWQPKLQLHGHGVIKLLACTS